MNNSYVTNSSEFISKKALEECSLRLNQPGDILIAMYGATIGKLGIAKIQLTTNQACCACTCYSGLFNIYLFIYLKAIKDKLVKQGSGGAQPNISREKIISNFIPLPPLEEQKRIVEKIEELEPYIKKYDSLEKQLTKLENEITDKLKKSILQYAIQGKLVKQNPNDEPASVLLERIKAEKEKLIKEGKIKRDKNESFIYQGDDKNYYENINGKVVNITDEIPFDIPDNWCWCRFKSIVRFNLGKTPERANSNNWTPDFPWVSISDMQDKEIIYNTKEKISNLALLNNFNNKYSPVGTLLMSFKLTVGKVSLLGLNAVHNEAIISIFPLISDNDIIKMFLFNFLGLLVQYCEKIDAIKGITLNKEKLNKMLIPFPSLNYQNKILQKLKELFNCIK